MLLLCRYVIRQRSPCASHTQRASNLLPPPLACTLFLNNPRPLVPRTPSLAADLDGLKAEASKRAKGDSDAEHAKKKQVRGGGGGGGGATRAGLCRDGRSAGCPAEQGQDDVPSMAQGGPAAGGRTGAQCL